MRKGITFEEAIKRINSGKIVKCQVHSHGTTVPVKSISDLDYLKRLYDFKSQDFELFYQEKERIPSNATELTFDMAHNIFKNHTQSSMEENKESQKRVFCKRTIEGNFFEEELLDLNKLIEYRRQCDIQKNQLILYSYDG